jgi:hypothetical protein
MLMQPNLPPQQPMAPNPYAQFMQPVPQSSGKGRSPFVTILLALLILCLLTFVGLFFWAYSSRSDYKNNSDKKSAVAVAKAVKAEDAVKDKEFAEKEKNPLKAYDGPATYGTLHIMYPKTWSAFISEKSNATTPIDGYLHPNFVPGLDSGTNYALRIRIVSKQYAEDLKQFDSLVKKGTVKVSAYQLPKVPSVTGSRVDGEIVKGQKSSMVLLPLRDKTVEISTQSAEFLNDFDNIILPNFSFIP